MRNDEIILIENPIPFHGDILSKVFGMQKSGNSINDILLGLGFPHINLYVALCINGTYFSGLLK